MQTVLKEVTSTHFIVTGWTPYLNLNSQEKQVPISIDVIKQKRILSVSHLHPSKSEDCREELKMLDVNDTESVMCLDADLKSDPCWNRINYF
ncbi:unnamed protein product [Diatraea saccharalis]|uniref:Uncharacterized protein n=1 Tax=Diatraea saccharalis TaxID=40085 RepID=A0A9N9WFI4_9NEOP|nr:unnamed protein product [Diatraea saccharalis]